MKSFIGVVLLLLLVVHIGAPPVAALSLEDLDDLDRRDVSDYIHKARKAADNENFAEAEGHLEQAAKFGVQKTEIEKAENYLSKKRQERAERLAAERRAREERRAAAEQKRRRASARSSTGGSSGSSSGSGRGLFGVTFETGSAFISLELDEYTVTIQRTTDLNGQSVWDSKLTETGGTGFFTGGSANFYDIPFGYYTVEAFGYNSDRKVYGSAWRNVQHKCEHSVVTIYGDNRNPYSHCW